MNLALYLGCPTSLLTFEADDALLTDGWRRTGVGWVLMLYWKPRLPSTASCAGPAPSGAVCITPHGEPLGDVSGTLPACHQSMGSIYKHHSHQQMLQLRGPGTALPGPQSPQVGDPYRIPSVGLSPRSVVGPRAEFPGE